MKKIGIVLAYDFRVYVKSSRYIMPLAAAVVFLYVMYSIIPVALWTAIQCLLYLPFISWYGSA